MNLSNKLPHLITSIKQGFADIKLVLSEGNYKLFLYPGVAVLALCLAYHYVSGKLQAHNESIKGKIEAVHAQQNNKQEYLSNKKKLRRLEPRFPDMESKKDSWLVDRLVSIFEQYPEITTNGKSSVAEAEDASNSGYVIVSVPVDLTSSYGDFGRLMADIESREEYLKVSEFSLIKSSSLGENTIKMRVNTVFPTEKLSSVLFKDNKKTSDKANKTESGGKK